MKDKPILAIQDKESDLMVIWQHNLTVESKSVIAYLEKETEFTVIDSSFWSWWQAGYGMPGEGSSRNSSFQFFLTMPDKSVMARLVKEIDLTITDNSIWQWKISPLLHYWSRNLTLWKMTVQFYSKRQAYYGMLGQASYLMVIYSSFWQWKTNMLLHASSRTLTRR